MTNGQGRGQLPFLLLRSSLQPLRVRQRAD
jgi:hypothetical protein